MIITEFKDREPRADEEWDGIWHSVDLPVGKVPITDEMIKWCNEVIGKDEFVYYGMGFSKLFFKTEEQKLIFLMAWAA